MVAKLFRKIKYFFSHDYCYDHLEVGFKREDGTCQGMVGGHPDTCNLAYQCVDCKYFSLS